jgi:hypothetical protein
MKTFDKHHSNPIHRDLIIVLGASLGAAIIIVSTLVVIFG